MQHKELKRIVKNANTAILFIHGIVGTPNHFDDFIKLVPDHISIYNMLLDGHGREVEDFANTSMKKWETQVQKAVDELSKSHKTIYLAAHSMGTLLSIEQAIRCEKIAKLFLLAVPIKLFLKPKMVTNSLKVFFNKIRPDDHLALAAKKAYGIEQDKNPIHYIGWIPRFLELFTKKNSTRRMLSLLKTPCFAYQSSKDEMVSIKSVKLLKQNPCIRVVELKKSGHFYYGKEDFAFLVSEFEKFIGDIPATVPNS